MIPVATQSVDTALLAAIRGHFPALARTHRGLPVAYFDGPGGTQVPRVVVEAMDNYLYHHNANTHWDFPASAETDEALDRARRAFADFFHAEPDEVVFGANMTTLTFHLARSLGRRLGPGDEVVVTELDHHANVAPWEALVRERGITLRTVRMRPESGQLDADDLAHQINEHTRVLAIGAASNALGTINDVAAAARLAHGVGALVFVDAVHYAPHKLVDVRLMDCDFLACSAYKFYGPHVGILFGRRELLQSIDVPKLRPAPDSAPERCETGTQNHEGIVGAAAAVDFLASLGSGTSRRTGLETAFAALHEHGEALLARLWDGLEAIAGVQLFGPRPGAPRTPTISFRVGDLPAANVCGRLAERAVFASHGDFYATTAVERLGQSRHGVVRLGCACYTTTEEVERVRESVHELARDSRRG
jgi:cysteine desulfurase family protein (TIGR01976 family)